MTIQEKFHEKLKADYDSFIERLLDMPKDKILDHAYEKVMKYEILSHFEDAGYISDEQALLMYAQNVDLDDLYNNYMKMDVSIREMIEDCNHYFIEEKLGALPGQEIQGTNIAGYDIKRAILFENDRGFAFGHNPNAVDPFATWQFTSENGKFDDCYWGKYFSYEEDALASFVERSEEYARSNGVKEKPVQEVVTEEQDRLYKVEINNPDEPAFPNFQVFHAQNDVDAVKQAYEICDEWEGEDTYLLEVHELDEDYNIIREIDLRNHDPSLCRFMGVDMINFPLEMETMDGLRDAPKNSSTTPSETPTPPTKLKKEPSFEEVLKAAQAKADVINQQNIQNKGQQPTINKNNIEIGE